MTERQYSTMLSLLILPPLVAEICRLTGRGESDVIGRLYHTELYEKLCDERLKLWHYSPVMLADMFVVAERTGVIPYPEEAS